MEYDMKYYEYNKEFDRECALGYFANPGLSRQLVAVSCLVTNLILCTHYEIAHKNNLWFFSNHTHHHADLRILI